MARRVVEMTIELDTRWPINPETGEGVQGGRVNGFAMFGWFTEAQLQLFLEKRRRGAIRTIEDGKRAVLIEITDTEYKKCRRIY